MKSFDILVVEDDIESFDGTISELMLEGYSVDVVSNCQDAQEHLHANAYAVILVDLRLPKFAGGELDKAGGLLLIGALRTGQFGTKNQEVPYVVISLQEFRIEKLEEEIHDQNLLEAIRRNRLLRYSKCNAMPPLLNCLKDAIGTRYSQLTSGG